jgi:heat shock protein HslJ
MKRTKLFLLLGLSIILLPACNTIHKTSVMKNRMWVSTNADPKYGVESADCLQVKMHGIWLVESINSLVTEPDMRPNIEINLNKMCISGEDSCNSYRGTIKQLCENNIEFKGVVSTRKMCRDMSVSKAFHNAMGLVRTYKCEGDQLYFFSVEGKRLMVLKKSN